ncbi:MAG TPA: hypothetical protein VLX59_05570, partial [Acidimicrobiales bacterium]|nr:hypothetical protein [Acidimicrobiales bacterium]
TESTMLTTALSSPIQVATVWTPVRARSGFTGASRTRSRGQEAPPLRTVSSAGLQREPPG